MADVKSQVEALKTKGNDALQKGDFDAAVTAYTEAIALDGNNHVLWSNRSAAYAKAEKYNEALEDANKTVSLNPSWARGYSRQGAALHGLKKFDDAITSYKKGLELEPGSATFTSAIAEVEKAKKSNLMADQNAIFNQFAQYFSEDMMRLVAMLPQAATYINDPSFQQAAASIRANPGSVLSHLKDKNIMNYIQLCTQMMSGGSGPFGGPSGDDAMDVDSNHDHPHPHDSQSSRSTSHSNATSKQAAPEKEPEPELTPEQKQVLDLKTRGNAAYTALKFDEALSLYREALAIEPENINILVNCTAVMFEQKKYEECLKACQEAVDLARSIRADYKWIGKALARVGAVYVKLGEPQKAVDYYKQSLTEFRDAGVLKTLRELEKKLEEDAKAAYVNPELAQKAKDEGNAFFKEHKFPEAVERYTEAIKRDPSSAVYLTNRATAFNKLAAYPSAVTDCDAALALDPKFVKAYTRKGQAYHFMREYTKAMESYEKGLAIDPDNQELNQLLTTTMQSLYGPADNSQGGTPEEIFQRAMANPEVREIWEDPAMRTILEQMSQDPKAAADHMRNPEVRRRINVLRAHGIIKTS